MTAATLFAATGSWMLAHPVAVVALVLFVALAIAMLPLLPWGRPATQAPRWPAADAYPVSEHAMAAALSSGLAPSLTKAQQRGAARHLEQQEYNGTLHEKVPAVCVVTGGTGFVGRRLVEMLVERGARRVISFDVVPKPADAWDDPRIQYVVGDITDKEAVANAIAGADCVWHNAAAVGPFHPLELYDKVNHIGTLNVIDACRQHRVPRIVMSTSPSTRFDGSDIDGLSEADLPKIPMKRYMQAYAASKAAGEKALTDACCDDLMTVAVAPHQVYGPGDNLFLPNVLEAAGSGMLRAFASARTGWGRNRVCFTHVDNYAHGLILAEKALYPGSPALGKFYIVTDGDTHPDPAGFLYFWEVMDQMAVAMGFPSILAKVMLPDWLLMPLAHLCDLIGRVFGRRLKLNPFNVRVLTMHRWFRIDAAIKDLGYYPIVPFREGWADTATWTRQHWLPKFQAARAAKAGGIAGIAEQSQRKIDIQAESALKEHVQ